MLKKNAMPDWLKINVGKRMAKIGLSNQLHQRVPNSVCEEAKCPNRSECWKRGTITFLILGTECTRNCKFCSVKALKQHHGKTSIQEIKDIVLSIRQLKLHYVVITSPTRDDLPDSGAGFYAMAISEIKTHYPDIKIEVLTPDFKGDMTALNEVLQAGPDVLNHNLETIKPLYSTVRPQAVYERSLLLLNNSKLRFPSILTKTGLMVGLGETRNQLIATFDDIAEQKVDILTIGQYIQPTKQQLTVEKYYTPDEFEQLKTAGRAAGIPAVVAGPLVRSSFLAENTFKELMQETLSKE